jgi:hypothetical protein
LLPAHLVANALVTYLPAKIADVGARLLTMQSATRADRKTGTPTNCDISLAACFLAKSQALTCEVDCAYADPTAATATHHRPES